MKDTWIRSGFGCISGVALLFGAFLLADSGSQASHLLASPARQEEGSVRFAVAQEKEAVLARDGRFLGTVQWGQKRALAQGAAYVESGTHAESPAYWRGAYRARQQALSNLESLAFSLGRLHHLAVNADTIHNSVARAVVVDRDFDPSSGQITLTVEAELYGRFGVLGPGGNSEVSFYDPYSTPPPAPVEVVSPGPIPAPVPPPVEAYQPPTIIEGDNRPGDTVDVEGPEVTFSPHPGVSPPGQEGPFTGVVIDCRGLHLSPSMSPKIRTPDGHEVWGTVQVNHKFAEEVGIAGFMDDWSRALSYEPRVGNHPLILRAIGISGGRGRSQAVISDADAAWLLREDSGAHFLKDFHVMFVVDPLKW